MMARNDEQAHYLGQLIGKDPDKELLAPIGLEIDCFRYNPGRLDDKTFNALNKEILIQIQEQGIYAPSNRILDGRYGLGVAIRNPHSDLV